MNEFNKRGCKVQGGHIKKPSSTHFYRPLWSTCVVANRCPFLKKTLILQTTPPLINLYSPLSNRLVFFIFYDFICNFMSVILIYLYHHVWLVIYVCVFSLYQITTVFITVDLVNVMLKTLVYVCVCGDMWLGLASVLIIFVILICCFGIRA